MNPLSAALERLRFAVRRLPDVLARATEAASGQAAHRSCSAKPVPLTG